LLYVLIGLRVGGWWERVVEEAVVEEAVLEN